MKDLWIYRGDFKVYKSMIINGKFIKDEIPDIIKGSFDCSNLELISLEGGTEKVEGDYYCSYNKLTSLEGCPKKTRDFDCSVNRLMSLEGCPKEVGGRFDCSYNNLTSLKGCLKKIISSFNCMHNKLTSLEGGPEKVYEGYYCSYNQLTSLEYIGKKVNYISSTFIIEQDFVTSRSYINNYWEDLLKYMINNNLDLKYVKGWPDYMTNKYPILKSFKGLSKFNL